MQLLDQQGVSQGAQNAKVSLSFIPEPRRPESFDLIMRQFSERYGLTLSMSWNPWYGYWTMLNAERVWDDGKQGFKRNTCVFDDLVYQNGEPMPLDNRIWEMLEKRFMGQTLAEKAKYEEKKHAAIDKAKADAEEVKHAALQEDAAKEFERLEKFPVRSFGANDKAASVIDRRSAEVTKNPNKRKGRAK